MPHDGTLTAPKIEAPVTQIADKQTAPTCRFTIQATLRGFPITIEGEGRAGDLKLIVERLLLAGAEPPNLPPIGAKPEPTKAAGVPTYPTHNSPMKPSRKPGKFYCARKADDGEYCRETA
jgi:hypothetical protein